MQFLIGTYTRGTGSDGIYALNLNSDSGALTTPSLVATADNPSWLTVRNDRLVVANEYADGESGGELSVYNLESLGSETPAGELPLLQNVPSHGADPCHLAISGNRLACANYSGSTVGLYEWKDRAIGRLIRILRHTESGNHPRQTHAHPHGAFFVDRGSSGEQLWVPDLGADRIFRYEPVNGDLLGEIQVPAGAGPRHLTADGGYLVNELDNTILPIVEGRAGPALSTLPDEWPRDRQAAASSTRAASSTAEIQAVNGHLYVSNRGHDSIAVFETRPEPRLIQHAPSGGRHPRHFVALEEGWLLIANKDSDNVLCLPLDSAGLIGEPVAEVFCPSPVCITRVR